MADRPIIFGELKVRHILGMKPGEEAQTRRVMKPQPPGDFQSLEVGPYHPTKVDRYGEEYPWPA